MHSSQSSVFFIIKLIFILLNILSFSSSSKCTDHPQCFRKSLFNFNFPQMNVFPISGTMDNIKSHQIKAYGDFDNNLYTDYIAINQQAEIQIFVWNQTEYYFQRKYTTDNIKNTCKVQTVYLYDVNQDGWLDFTVWGVFEKTIEKYNCLIPFLRLPDEKEYLFEKALTYKLQKTTNPILIANKFISQHQSIGFQHQSIGFLIFGNGTRAFLKYENFSTPVYKSIQWKDLTINGQEYQSKKFAQPHWNTFMDLTGDCLPDLLLYNQDRHLELWVSQGRKYAFSKIFDQLGGDLKGFSISDINYDGTGDLVLVFDTQIRIHLNQAYLTAESEFCSPSSRIFTIGPNFISIKMPLSQLIKPQSLHFGDIDINGYPDLLFIVTNSNKKDIPVIYQNNFENEETFVPFLNPNYNDPLAENIVDSQVISASFIDILENGILDIIVVTKKNNKIQTSMFYNNFLCQNDYYVKGYGMIGPQIGNGSQYPAMSFYWINSVKDGFRVTYQSQMIQTSYDALHMPYTFNGLGRANNYVESFTIGRNGLSKCWSPIIPNSQLAVYTTNGNIEDWEIRIFAFPVSQLISVVIVTTFVLSIFGIILMIIKCKTYQKKEEPLMMQLNQ